MAGFLGKAIGGAMMGVAQGMRQQILLDYETAMKNLERQDRLDARAEDRQWRLEDRKADQDWRTTEAQKDRDWRTSESAAERAARAAADAADRASRLEAARISAGARGGDEAQKAADRKKKEAADLRANLIERYTTDDVEKGKVTDWRSVGAKMLQAGYDVDGRQLPVFDGTRKPTARGAYKTPNGPLIWTGKKWKPIRGYDYGE